MKVTVLATFALAAGVVATAALRTSTEPTVQVTDFGAVGTPTASAYRAELAPVSRAGVKEFRIPIRDATVEIAAGVTYRSWTFGGTVPGPVIRVQQGDLVKIKLVNEASLPHSIDFHAARIPMSAAFRTILPKDSLSFEFTARDVSFFDSADEQWENGQHGALVEEVKAGSWAELGSLSNGDLILELDGQPVNNVESLRKIMEQLVSSRKSIILMKVLRGIHTSYLQLEPNWKS